MDGTYDRDVADATPEFADTTTIRTDGGDASVTDDSAVDDSAMDENATKL